MHFLILIGCAIISKPEFDARQDFDGDGFVGTQYGGDDCDDAEGTVNPGAAELCDGVDNDCDGVVDNDDAMDAGTWYADADGDGYGGGALTACQRPNGYVPNGDDCNDDNAAVNPGVTDEWYDGEDSDCGGNSDLDKDGDGFDSNGYGGTDCNDEDSAINPGATEVWYDTVDQDCNGESDFDEDSDGYDSQDWGGQDCNDEDGSVHPDATDTWYDGIDSDCDGLDDFDQDGDGHDNTGSGGDDCDDGDGAVYSGATEYCDDIDQDCDGDTVDSESADAQTFYADTDGDRYGDADSPQTACSQPEAYVTDNQDCDDTSASVTYITWYADSDGDNYGNVLTSTTSCTKPLGYVLDNTDCDDLAAGTNPGEIEVCDALNTDEDCDTLPDDHDPSVTGLSTWYADFDGDGFGDASNSVALCDPSARYVADATDCDDGEGAISPAATEVCDALDLDEDCDLLVDDADSSVSGQLTLYVDADGDGYGAGAAFRFCDDPSGYSVNATDCDDADATLNPATGNCNISLADADATILAEASGDWVGGSVAAGGDVNADGYVDILVGASGNDAGGTSAGAAYVVLGPSSGDISLASADAKFVGESTYDGAGARVAFGGDVNADGYGDVWVGATGDDEAAENAGAAYLLLGPLTGTFSLAAYDAKLLGEGYYNGAGSSLDVVGDNNADGIDDIQVGAANGGTGSMVYLVEGPFSGRMDLGSATAKLVSESNYDYFGYATAHGDLNADGAVDLFLGAYGANSGGSDSGAVYLFDGPVTGAMGTSGADAQLIGESADDWAGASVACAGDMNLDGYEDLIVGASSEDSGGDGNGAAYLVLGPISGDVSLSTSAAKFVGGEYDSLNEGVGGSVAAAGDLDLDGYPDVVIGASNKYVPYASYYGGGFVMYGPMAGSYDYSTADATFEGTADGDAAGVAVAGAGDVDHDGMLDILVGASGAGPGGSVYLVLGSSL